MSNNKGNSVASGRNQNDLFESFIVLRQGKDKTTETNDIVTGIYYEAVVPERKINFFNKNMIGFVDRLELNDHKYQSNINVRE